jgi:hypothetical protein
LYFVDGIYADAVFGVFTFSRAGRVGAGCQHFPDGDELQSTIA